MPTYFSIFVFVLCSGNVFTLLREERNSYTYDVFMKEAHVYSEYDRYMQKSYEKYKLEIVGLTPLFPNEEQRLAILLDKLLTVELSIILAAYSIHSMEVTEIDSEAKIDYQKVVGCVNFMDYLHWHSETVLPIDTLISHYSQRDDTDDVASSSADESYYFPAVAEQLKILLTDVKKLNEILIEHKYDFSHVFEFLQQANPENLGINEVAPISVPRNIDNKRRREVHYKEVFNRLVKYFGQNLLDVKNFFRSVFLEQPISRQHTVIMSLEDVNEFIEKVHFIRWGLVLSKDYINIAAPVVVQTDLLELLKPTRGMSPSKENYRWEVRFDRLGMQHPEFKFLVK